MTDRKKKWLIGSGLFALIGFGALYIVTSILVNRSEPYIREQAIRYLRDRFDSEVELTTLHVHMPNTSPLRLIMTRGRGIFVRVEGEGISLRHKGRHDLPPMFAMKKLSFEVDLRSLFDTPKTIPQVTLDGVEINIPPKGQRPEYESRQNSSSNLNVIIQEVFITDAKLTILPKEQGKVPLQFNMHRLRLESVGNDVPMKFDASLTNAKPPGEILSTGNLGPWVADEPGDTPLDGQYNFDKADLSVFSGIAGILHSVGEFQGSLGSINVKGQADVPDFRLKISGNPVSLTTRFEVLVDGTNGNTILKPVVARLGTTDFTTSGAVIKHEGDEHRSVSLDVIMPQGNLTDLLRLAMKGSPFMQGQIFLKAKVDVPPLSGKVREKLRLNGKFEVAQGKFLRSNVQDKVDGLSRRGQGEPKNEEIDEVVSGMKGVFDLEGEVITFRSLSFGVPGAAVDLAGDYHFDGPLDFHGTLKLDAKVSQTMTGWKRWVLKPVDPFFAKNGSGTFLRIKVDGTADQPKFALDRGKKDEVEPGAALNGQERR
jgi:hypothetical protein